MDKINWFNDFYSDVFSLDFDFSSTIANKLTLNGKKSNYVIFHPYRRKIQSVINLIVFDNEHKPFRNLSLNDHVANVALKISKTIGIIARLRCYIINQ